jgi:peptidyl-dipeptidase Dcp
MAKTPAAVSELLRSVWKKALERAEEERDALAAEARRSGDNADIMPWDWRYYSEKVRKAKYDFDEAQLKPYLQLDNMIRAAFDCASRLFGLTFKERQDLPRYHSEVRTWEVLDKSGAHVGIFMGDYFARPSKRSGAWMSGFRSQHKLGKGETPIIVNVLNFTKGADGEPALLSFDDARTLFHEFGHALHGLLSNVTYPSISGTSVARDFVELPSQLYEHWLSTPEVLDKHARHYKTGKPMPKELRAGLSAARTFNQGFATVEYTSSALVDMALYATESAIGDVERFERETLDTIGMPAEIVMRHRLPHFMHIMSGYAAGYYSYLWSEVMDADAFEAFEEAGNVFHPATAKKLHEFIYSAGNKRDPLEAYVAFRGRAPKIDGLLKKRGFAV